MQITNLSSTSSYAVTNTSKMNSSNTLPIADDPAIDAQSKLAQEFDARGVSYASGQFKITNIIDFLTPSDKDLFQKATGLTLKDGGTYDSDGNYKYTSGSLALLNALSDMRESGVPGSNQTSMYQSGAFTANDITDYIKAHMNDRSFDSSGLTKAAQILT